MTLADRPASSVSVWSSAVSARLRSCVGGEEGPMEKVPVERYWTVRREEGVTMSWG